MPTLQSSRVSSVLSRHSRPSGGVVGRRKVPTTGGYRVNRSAGRTAALQSARANRSDWNLEQLGLQAEREKQLLPILAQLQQSREGNALDAYLANLRAAQSWDEGARDLEYRAGESAADRQLRELMQDEEFAFRANEAAAGRGHDITMADIQAAIDRRRMAQSHEYDKENLAIGHDYRMNELGSQQGFMSSENELDRGQRERLQMLSHSQAIDRDKIRAELDQDRMAFGDQLDTRRLDRQHEQNLERDQQQSDLTNKRLQLGHELSLDELSQSHKLDLESMGQGHKFDLDRLESSNRLEMERMGFGQGLDLDRAAFNQQLDVGLQEMAIEQQRIDEGVKNGSLRYTNKQKQDRSRLDHAIAETQKATHLSPSQRAEATASLIQQKAAIKPIDVPMDERPAKIEEIVNSKLYTDENGDKWTVTKDGEIQAPRNHSRPQGDDEYSRQLEQYKIQYEVWRNNASDKSSFITELMKLTDVEGNPLYNASEATAIADERYGNIEMPRAPWNPEPEVAPEDATGVTPDATEDPNAAKPVGVGDGGKPAGTGDGGKPVGTNPTDALSPRGPGTPGLNFGGVATPDPYRIGAAEEGKPQEVLDAERVLKFEQAAASASGYLRPGAEGRIAEARGVISRWEAGGKKNQSEAERNRETLINAWLKKPKTKEEFDAMPSGTVFVAPDGTIRRKP